MANITILGSLAYDWKHEIFSRHYQYRLHLKKTGLYKSHRTERYFGGHKIRLFYLENSKRAVTRPWPKFRRPLLQSNTDIFVSAESISSRRMCGGYEAGSRARRARRRLRTGTYLRWGNVCSRPGLLEARVLEPGVGRPGHCPESRRGARAVCSGPEFPGK